MDKLKAFEPYLVDDGRGGKNIKYNDLMSPMFGAKALEMGASRASFSAGAIVGGRTPAELTPEVKAMGTFANIGTVEEVFRSIVISFCSLKKFVITEHFTALGCALMHALTGKDYREDQEYYQFGTFDLSLEGTGELDCGVRLNDGSTLDCVLKPDGLVTIQNHIFTAIPTVIVDETPNACGGTDPEALLPNLNDGGCVMMNVRYGDRVMRKVTQADGNYESYKDESEEQRTMRQTLNLYIPAKPDRSKENAVVLCIHGGSWIGGDKSAYDAACKYYAHLGYFAATMNHTYAGRVYEDNGEIATFHHIEEEIDMAMAKIKLLSDENGWNITKAATTGYSSGSHLATLYAYHLGSREGAPIPVTCTFSMVGPMSFYMDCWTDLAMPIGPQIAGIGLNDPNLFVMPPEQEKLAELTTQLQDPARKGKINGLDYTTYDEETYRAKLDSVSPLSYVKRGRAVPTVLAEAGLDNLLISIEHGIRMEEALTEAGIDHKVIIFPNSDHMGAGNAECGNVYRKYQKLFLKKYLGF